VRVLFLAPVDLSRAGGQAVHVRRITEALQRRGHELRLLTHQPGAGLVWGGPTGGLAFAGGPSGFRLPWMRHFVSEWALARALGRESRRFRPDLLLVRQEALSVAPWLAGMTASPRLVPLVVESNSSLPAVASSAGASPGRVAWLASWEGRLLRAADAVGAVTPALARGHAARHRVAEDRLFVVPNGAWIPPALGASPIVLRRTRGVGDHEFLLVFAGNLNAVQGLDLLLELLARPDLASVRGWIIGESRERAHWQQRASSLGARVEFLGALSEEETACHLQAAQAVVAPYRADDYARVVGGPSSLKVLTALACDRPLLVTDAPGLESLRGVASVLLVPAGDIRAWADALRTRAEEWRRAGRPLHDWPWPDGQGPGRRFIEAGHTWDHTAAAWEPAFARAIAESTRRSRSPAR
jgi:glycosyltransferase involved in cell wall biosynthesis